MVIIFSRGFQKTIIYWMNLLLQHILMKISALSSKFFSGSSQFLWNSSSHEIRFFVFRGNVFFSIRPRLLRNLPLRAAASPISFKFDHKITKIFQRATRDKNPAISSILRWELPIELLSFGGKLEGEFFWLAFGMNSINYSNRVSVFMSDNTMRTFHLFVIKVEMNISKQFNMSLKPF